MKEEWREVVGFEGLYIVSCQAKVKGLHNTKRYNNKFKKATKNSEGYYRMS